MDKNKPGVQLPLQVSQLQARTSSVPEPRESFLELVTEWSCFHPNPETSPRTSKAERVLRPHGQMMNHKLMRSLLPLANGLRARTFARGIHQLGTNCCCRCRRFGCICGNIFSHYIQLQRTLRAFCLTCNCARIEYSRACSIRKKCFFCSADSNAVFRIVHVFLQCGGTKQIVRIVRGYHGKQEVIPRYFPAFLDVFLFSKEKPLNISANHRPLSQHQADITGNDGSEHK